VQAELASLHSRAAALERRRTETRRELAVARQVYTVSQGNLANRLRTVYEQGESDPLAIVLGAKTLDDALSALETAKAATATDRTVVTQARTSRDKYLEVEHRLAARAQELRTLEASVAATANSLASAKAQRISYLRQLAAQRSLNTTQIGSLESRAQAIEAQARRVAIEQAASTQTTAPVASAPATGGPGTLTVSATAYTLPGHTATGAPVGYGVVAVDPSVIPLGTRMTIPGYGEGVAADTAWDDSRLVIDLWFRNGRAGSSLGAADDHDHVALRAPFMMEPRRRGAMVGSARDAGSGPYQEIRARLRTPPGADQRGPAAQVFIVKGALIDFGACEPPQRKGMR
jgi:3D (Asp-Asp-Asp) domain-containing protein